MPKTPEQGPQIQVETEPQLNLRKKLRRVIGTFAVFATLCTGVSCVMKAEGETRHSDKVETVDTSTTTTLLETTTTTLSTTTTPSPAPPTTQPNTVLTENLYTGQSCDEGRIIRGTFEGEDGRYINGQVSLDLLDANGLKIGMDGQPLPNPLGGYSHHFYINSSIPGDSLPQEAASEHPYPLFKDWCIENIPENANQVFVESYTLFFDNGVTSHGSLDPNRSRYGHSMTNSVPLTDAVTEIPITQPMVCRDGSEPGADTGSINYNATVNGQPIAGERLVAWSQNGIGFGAEDAAFFDNQFQLHTLIGLNSSESYRAQFQGEGYTILQDHVPVEPCTPTEVSYFVEGNTCRTDILVGTAAYIGQCLVLRTPVG